MRAASVLTALALAAYASPTPAHEIYTGVHGKDGRLCCGGNDCAATSYREKGGSFEFLTRENEWVAIPQDRITFLPVPGDPPSDDSHRAHLCYRLAMPEDSGENNFGPIHLYCAFIPPGGV
jgi:uncharacterized membrane protein